YRMAARAQLDADGDGRPDLELPAGGETEYRYPAQGVYCAQAILQGADGTTGLSRTWVEAVGHRERKGVHLLVHFPRPNEIVEKNEPLRASAISYSGARIARVDAAIDGRPAGSALSAPYEIQVPWDALGPGEHALSVAATDAKGERKSVERKFQVSEFFDLFPREGSQITGQSVAVSWSGRTFGPAFARFRKAGEKDWAKTTQGQNARVRRIALDGLEPGVAYEFQAAGAGESPVRTVTRVKGLAFGKTKYASTIKRDYDQKVGVSVRNHGEKPLTVRLECGKPPEESKLLVGFVGEGSEGAPIDLKPGEEREFLLGISAQDCVSPKVAFPIRLVSLDTGISDESQVEVDVRLPRVALEWEVKGDAPGKIGSILSLKNKGDTLTDLDVASETGEILVSPSIRHGLLRAGGGMDIVATPRLKEGFQSVTGKISARAVGKTTSLDVHLALPKGQKIFLVDLVPGEPPEGTPPDEKLIQEARSLGGEFLNAAEVDWSQRGHAQDVDGDGKFDRWQVEDPNEDILWIGDDTDGDGEIDFAHADVGLDGQFDYSAFKDGAKWQPTNLLEAWLEVSFRLPWARSAYEKHDVDVLLNDQVVGRLRDVIPEGNSAFRLSPKAMRFGTDGSPEGNAVSVKTRHLRGGHYIVASDFQIKLRTLRTSVYVAAPTREEAEKQVHSAEGLQLTGSDYSVSSGEIALQGPEPPVKGSDLTVTVPLRNLGATGTRTVDVALMRSPPGGQPVELARQTVENPPVLGSTLVRLPWKATSGKHSLSVVADPDRQIPDSHRANNEAVIAVEIPGDDTPPAIQRILPADGTTSPEMGMDLVIEASDDVGVTCLEARVDGGLWRTLPIRQNGGSGRLLLQPGMHAISVRATDGGGNQVEKQAKLTVEGKPPSVRIVEPAEGATIGERSARVRIQTEGEAVLAAVRVNQGTWALAPVRDNQSEVDVPLPFGSCRLDVAAVSSKGAVGMASRGVGCTRQPQEGDEPAKGRASGAEGIMMVAGLPASDILAAPSQILGGTESAAAAKPAQEAPAVQPIERPAAIAGGTRCVYRSASADVFLAAEFAEVGVRVQFVRDGKPIMQFDGPLQNPQWKEGTASGKAEVPTPKGSASVTYSFSGNGAGALVRWDGQEDPTGGGFVWYRVRDVGVSEPFPASLPEGGAK
ncbi:MAG: CARDB domain-containing protein, partial [Planctomycetota bacterium]